MKELKNIYSAYQKYDFENRPGALATVVKVKGSAYRRPGARMFVTDDGRYIGGISGGCLEGDALRKARRVMESGKPEIVTYDTMDDEAAMNMGIGLGCNGVIDILIEPIDAAMHGFFHEIGNLPNQKTPSCIATIIQSSDTSSVGAKHIFQNGEHHILYNTSVSLSQKIAAIIDLEGAHPKSHITTVKSDGESYEILFEWIQPSIHLYLFGGGFDINPIIHIAKMLDWKTTVANDCTALSAPARFPESDFVEKVDRSLIGDHFTFDERSAILLISHNYAFDLEVLKSFYPKKFSYLGILGPKKRFDKLRKDLISSGKNEEAFFEQIFSPSGLNIGADTPDEIAVSIISEIQAAFKNKNGGFLKSLNTPIHKRHGSEDLTFA